MTPNFFTPSAYDLISFTQAINKIPNMYGKVRDLGIFSPDPITTLTFTVEEANGVLSLVPSKPRGGPASLNTSGKRKMRSFTVPHFPVDDVVLPGEVQGIRAFGTEATAETVAGVYARKLQDIRNRHAITLEWLRVQALQGKVLDADGSELVNWFTEFGITQDTVPFILGTTTTEVLTKCLAVKRLMENNLRGEVMSQIIAYCSAGFFDALTTHTTVKAAYANYQEAATRLGTDQRAGFTFGGITFIDYGSGVASDAAGTVRRFIPVDEAICFPIGTLNTFRTVQAPGDFIETVNTPGLELYARTENRRMGQGVDIHTEMNVLPICKRPALLIKITKA